jgi:nucleotide-binding universal stress UspA family protein
MFDEVIACLDGSSLAETILPLARGLTATQGGTLTLLRVVADAAELSAEENYLRDCARQYSGQLRFLVAADPAGAIGAELERNANAIAALTTHGRTAWGEAILGSVALRVIRAAKRPVILYCPLDRDGDAPKKISKIVLALDGSEFAERMISYAAKAAQSLRAQLLLVQALPVGAPLAPLKNHEKSDISESGYLHRQAAEIKKKYAVPAQWEVLHGDPAAAICQYLKGMPETMLMLTTHARGAVERAMLGSVAAECIRHAGVPLLLYWPPALR